MYLFIPKNDGFLFNRHAAFPKEVSNRRYFKRRVHIQDYLS